MNRRVVRGLAVLGCLVVVSATATVVVEARAGGDRASAFAAHSEGLPSPEVMKYWADSKTALSPLLLYVRQLPATIKAIQGAGGNASEGALGQAHVMAEGFATARDLVGRIAVPAGAPAGVGEILQVACQLYRESALTLLELKTAGDGGGRMTIAARAASLHAIGDRLFDQARRTLAIDAVGKGQAPVEYQYAPPVPAVTELTGQSAPARAGAPNVDEELRTAGMLISGASAGSDEASGTTFQTLRVIAGALENGSGVQGEDVLGARLAIALALVAEDAKRAGRSKSPDSLLMLSNDLWNSARTLSSRPNPAITPLAAPKLPRSMVWTGGQFNGSPPALKPGQDVGAGLPGGLPEINPTKILEG